MKNQKITELSKDEWNLIPWRVGDFFYGKKLKDVYQIKKIEKVSELDGSYIICLAETKNRVSTMRHLENIDSQWNGINELVSYNKENMIKVDGFNAKREMRKKHV